VSWLPWAILAAAVLHVIEEYSTGFLPWFRRAIPALARAMTPAWALGINAMFLAFLLVAAIRPAPMLTLTAAALVALNAVLHVAMTIRMREYSPGLITALLLYLPLGVLAGAHETGTGGAAAAGRIALSIVLAAAIHALAPLSLLAMRK
jgi:hypothetical protein